MLTESVAGEAIGRSGKTNGPKPPGVEAVTWRDYNPGQPRAAEERIRRVPLIG
jgi:hypothetical protein